MSNNQVSEIRNEVAKSVSEGNIFVIADYGKRGQANQYSPNTLTHILKVEKSEGYKWIAQLFNTKNAENDVVRFLLIKDDLSDKTKCKREEVKSLLEFHELGIFGGNTIDAKAGVFVNNNLFKGTLKCEPWEYLNILETQGII